MQIFIKWLALLFFQEKLDKVALRIEYQSQDAEMKLLTLKKNNELIKRQLEDRSSECNALEEKIQNLKVQVNLSKSVKFSRDEARGGTGGDPVTMAATKMKKVVARRHMVDTARAQAEEIDYLRQELDKMRQRTFPSFVRYNMFFCAQRLCRAKISHAFEYYTELQESA